MWSAVRYVRQLGMHALVAIAAVDFLISSAGSTTEALQ
jgi:hypothetical protein